jgi:DNA repair exonuclease SbcCD ATPase subunit
VRSYPPAPTIIQSPVREWLAWQAQLAALESSDIEAQLANLAAPATADQRFYYALLNQETARYDNWVTARDFFRQLHLDNSLQAEQRELAGLMEQYNQKRINWHHRHEQLQQRYRELEDHLRQLQQQNTLLEQQIQAITDLEETISTRREE